MENKGEVIIYQNGDGLSKLEVNLQDETVHQNFQEDALVKAFEREMAERGIECHVKEGVNDVAELKLPEKVSR